MTTCGDELLTSARFRFRLVLRAPSPPLANTANCQQPTTAANYHALFSTDPGCNLFFEIFFDADRVASTRSRWRHRLGVFVRRTVSHAGPTVKPNVEDGKWPSGYSRFESAPAELFFETRVEGAQSRVRSDDKWIHMVILTASLAQETIIVLTKMAKQWDPHPKAFSTDEALDEASRSRNIRTTKTMTMTHSEKSRINQMRALALQARVSGPWPLKKESVLLRKLAHWQGVQVQTVMDRV